MFRFFSSIFWFTVGAISASFGLIYIPNLKERIEHVFKQSSKAAVSFIKKNILSDEGKKQNTNKSSDKKKMINSG